MGRETLHSALTRLLNEQSRENNSNTPDYILARYMERCLEAYEATIAEREKWWGVDEESRVRARLDSGDTATFAKKVKAGLRKRRRGT